MRKIETGRDDIQVLDKQTPDRPISLAMVAKYGDQTIKTLTRAQAVDLARALIIAAGECV